MASKRQMTGMLGVYLTAAELVKRGFIVSPTSRSALGADLLVTDQRCHKAWSVQVKTNRSNAKFWLAGKKTKEIKSPTHIYIFVSLPKDNTARYFVVPSKIVAKTVRKSGWGQKGATSWYRDQRYENKWRYFGNPEGPQPASGIKV
jgi:hypothetical protein